MARLVSIEDQRLKRAHAQHLSQSAKNDSWKWITVCCILYFQAQVISKPQVC